MPYSEKIKITCAWTFARKPFPFICNSHNSLMCTIFSPASLRAFPDLGTFTTGSAVLMARLASSVTSCQFCHVLPVLSRPASSQCCVTLCQTINSSSPKIPSCLIIGGLSHVSVQVREVCTPQIRPGRGVWLASSTGDHLRAER